jgi:hypothetical protein
MLAGSSSCGVKVSRRERQRHEIRSALAGRHYARALVLSREHLAEFPSDRDVAAALDEALRHQAGDALSGDG